YDERHIAALRAVRSLRRRGLALDEIRSSLPALLVPETATEGSAIDAELLEQVADASPAARLVDAALRGFSTHGFDEMSVATLCSDAGVAKATFYRCFGSKDALFVAAANAAVERAVAGFTAEMAGGESTDHAAIFARHLRASLPVLLELAKRTTQEPAATVGATVSLFAELAE